MSRKELSDKALRSMIEEFNKYSSTDNKFLDETLSEFLFKKFEEIMLVQKCPSVLSDEEKKEYRRIVEDTAKFISGLRMRQAWDILKSMENAEEVQSND